MRQTGGSAVGAISTRSSPAASARDNASAVDSTPSASPSASITRTRGVLISVLIRVESTLVVGRNRLLIGSLL